MSHRWIGLGAVVLLSGFAEPKTPTVPAWPHRAMLKSLDNRPVAFQAYTLGGDLIIMIDRAGNRIATSVGIPRVRPLTPQDTISAETPGDFPLDLTKGPVVFTTRDSLRLTVGGNPHGSVNQVSATGKHFTVRLVDDRFVIDAR